MKYFVAAVAAAAASAHLASAFAPQSTPSSASSFSPPGRSSSSSALFNVPPPSSDDVVATKDYASKLPPPASFFQLQQDCLAAANRAIVDDQKLLEVEFPPLPASVLELDDVSAYDVAQANLQLAVEFARGMVATSGNGVEQVTILLPDEDEKAIAIERFTGKSRDQVDESTYNVDAGVTVSSLRRSEAGDQRLIKPEQTFLNLFGMGDDSSQARSEAVKPIEGTDLYIVLVASAQELPDVEALADQVPDTPVVFYNLKLDVLRGDLGAPAFPPKSFQDRFLSRVKPVYYLRTRQYSRSTPTPPFLINYQGCLFRSYPGQYQTLLDTGTGSYRRLRGSDVRPGLGAFKEELTEALREEGVLPKTEGGALDFLRVGYKTTTWWEEDREEASLEWRT
mmetsp:Transcript_33085/g.78193  ORF Transcript_33085/g.78193 Transcript_33085/m.78193 type:complete len:395 (-) Transcript_33085:2062-3246(-)|eukprot:CAMPEP_0172399794 /NCGR_PEP_ID=MMETSP1061-20121228/42559_1 /TAXON_ID=37318 /ORGANISM="Pseudo-nitzschia pungens, Strain cf. pungens" /LENGTH=394 /DNA_ID=CAMNT_0013132781 /DNA_START=121 /DNA_END=1305 /DNA_ORIENTATION=-